MNSLRDLDTIEPMDELEILSRYGSYGIDDINSVIDENAAEEMSLTPEERRRI